MAKYIMSQKTGADEEGVNEEYISEGSLESGSNTVFRACRVRDNKLVVLKAVNKETLSNWEEYNGERIPFEVAVILKLKDVPGVVKILEHFEDTDYYTFVMESGGSLDMARYISEQGGFSEETSKHCFRKVAHTLLACKQKGVYHRDIKPENIAMDLETLNPTVIDFGLAAYAGSESHGFPTNEDAGVHLLFPPECVQGRSYEGNSGTVWSLGLLLYRMIFGRKLFESPEETVGLDVLLPSGISEECQDLLYKCLEKDPSKRLEFDNILDHPWFK